MNVSTAPRSKVVGSIIPCLLNACVEDVQHGVHKELIFSTISAFVQQCAADGGATFLEPKIPTKASVCCFAVLLITMSENNVRAAS